MSWKIILSAGLLCVVASPLFAAPTLSITNGPALDANGNWVWTVKVTPSATSTPVATELGFVGNKNVVGTPTIGAAFDTANPGNVIFGWETLTAAANNKPVGVQVGTAANAAQVFSAEGSGVLPDAPTATTYLTIVTSGPTNTSLTGSLQVKGVYGTGNAQGRIAELNGATATNYTGYAGTATRTIVNGDINLDGKSDNTDFGIFAGKYQPGVNKVGGWTIGDFNGDGKVDNTDFGIFAGTYNPTAAAGGSNTPLNVTGVAGGAGAGLAGGGAVPEPASIVLIGLGLLGGLGLIRRKR